MQSSYKLTSPGTGLGAAGKAAQGAKSTQDVGTPGLSAPPLSAASCSPHHTNRDVFSLRGSQTCHAHPTYPNHSWLTTHRALIKAAPVCISYKNHQSDYPT